MIRLPDEIWCLIFSKYEYAIPDVKWTLLRDRINHDPINVLINLSRVCRQFYRVAQDLIYRIILSGVGDDEHERQVKLARSLALHPQLGLNVRAIAIDDTGLPTDARLASLLEDRIRSLNMPQTFWTLWDQRTQIASTSTTPRNRNNLPTFMLALMPSVKLVDITYTCPSQALFWILGGSLGQRGELANADFSELYYNGDGQTPPYGNLAESYANHLPNLQELRLRGADYNSAIEPSPPMADFRRVLLHPTLLTLRVQGFHWLSFGMETRLWASLPIRVQRLDLSEVIIDAPTIRHILTICKDLRSLFITLGNVQKAGVDANWEFNLTDIGNALRRQGRKLFEFGLLTDGFEAHRPCQGKLGSLERMPDLRHLYLTKDNLVGVHGSEDMLNLNETLPFTLETLCFYPESRQTPEADYPDVYQEVNDEVCGVLVSYTYPELREVTLLRCNTEEKIRGGEFGAGVEGWNLAEDVFIETGDNNKEIMHINTLLTRKPGYRPDIPDMD
ncbi:hypothetical protein CEP52_008720 [Fusarium oligoseptatum]|uniref:F-box domain-containing protein n=1 Tax=Fusarium oligoseptatum TaxID=2604345 RepID=A0A428TGA9_9HYPO|nr:hypothetical protein CEP52_008720 [Fusarium oligoseptatum]